MASAASTNPPSTLGVYKVIEPLSTDANIRMAVQIEGDRQVYSIPPSTIDSILHVGSAPTQKKYRYLKIHNNGTVVDRESFQRAPNAVSNNDFYGRQQTFSSQQSMIPSVFPDGKTYYRLDTSIAHPINEIPTIHVQAPHGDLESLHDNYLDPIAINVNMSHIRQTSRLFDKFSYNFHFSKHDDSSLGGYRRFKLRSCTTDPSFIREKLYYDILDSSSLPASKASYVRLFVNKKPMGLYLFIDNYKSPFVDNLLNGGNNEKHGILYQGSMPENPMAPGILGRGANLEYAGSNIEDYFYKDTSAYKLSEDGSKKQKGFEPLVKLIKFIHDPQPDEDEKEGVLNQGETPLERAWNKRIDIDVFLKNMAFEVLMGHVDGYLGQAHNYFLYREPGTKKFLWMTADLDQTMGSSMIPVRDARSISLNDQRGHIDRFDLMNKHHNRPILKQVLSVPAFNQRFDTILKTVHQNLFTNPALFKHIDFLTALIKEDVAWDSNIRHTHAQAVSHNATSAKKKKDQIQEKILQLPLGHDFLSRIGNINFMSAIEGPIRNHPSLMPLKEWLNETKEALHNYVNSV
ncbi:secreted coth spore-coat protein domain-containing protein [Phycomyces blakesleeanus]|uniref:Secreted coth spore-coat protein domain-containing protein n=1 Tax=Phycomyces blakesleeanus TaxID=4837 RepID=A0ABR3AN33_PHYBL